MARLGEQKVKEAQQPNGEDAKLPGSSASLRFWKYNRKAINSLLLPSRSTV